MLKYRQIKDNKLHIFIDKIKYLCFNL